MKSYFWLAAISVALFTLAFPASGQDISISINTAPPPLVEDEQPDCPQDGYLWTPGYWAYDQDAGEYYWVDGAWVQPPEVGMLWTPSYWGWNGNDYVFYPGYWGPTVGFYGGINYGHGYWGHGYGGGRWNEGHFSYNLAANRVSRARVHSTYEDRKGFKSASARQVSYNGGKGGTSVQPSAEERQSRQQNHAQATQQQTAHFQSAAQSRTHVVKAKNAPSAGPGGAGTESNAKTQPTANTQPTAKKKHTQAPAAAAMGETQPSRRDTAAPSNPALKERPQPAAGGILKNDHANESRGSEVPATREAAPPRESATTHEAPASRPAPAPAAQHEKKAPAPQAKPAQGNGENHPDAHPQGPSQGAGQGGGQGQGAPAPQDRH